MNEVEGHNETAKFDELRTQLNDAMVLIFKLNEDTKKQRDQLTSCEEKVKELQKAANTAIKAASAGADRIEKLRQVAETHVKQIEEDTRKANSESGFAFNAKGNAEEHAKAIAQIRGTVESTFSGLTSTKAQTDDAASAIFSAKTTAEQISTIINELKNSAAEKAAQVTAANERVTAVLPSIEKGSRDANAITAAKASAEASSSSIQQLQAQIAEEKAK